MNAMHLAAVRNAEGVVGALLMHADAQKMCDATDANGKTPHALATARGHAELATALSEWDPKLLSAPTAWQWWALSFSRLLSPPRLLSPHLSPSLASSPSLAFSQLLRPPRRQLAFSRLL